MIYLLIEFLDELVFGVGEIAWPLIRDDLHLTYTQIGLLLSAPGIIAAFSALKCKEVWRWLLLLEFADLMMDVLLSYMALYFVDVVNVSETQAGIAVAIWLILGMITDYAFIHYIDRQPDSIKFLQRTAVLQLIFFPIFLLIPGFIPKMIAIVFVNFCNTGWYPILQGRLYSNLPGQSASVMAIGAVTTPIAKFFPLTIGFLADGFGLHNAMWILLLAPLALLVGLPRTSNNNSPIP